MRVDIGGGVFYFESWGPQSTIKLSDFGGGCAHAKRLNFRIFGSGPCACPSPMEVKLPDFRVQISKIPDFGVQVSKIPDFRGRVDWGPSWFQILIIGTKFQKYAALIKYF